LQFIAFVFLNFYFKVLQNLFDGSFSMAKPASFNMRAYETANRQPSTLWDTGR